MVARYCRCSHTHKAKAFEEEIPLFVSHDGSTETQGHVYERWIPLVTTMTSKYVFDLEQSEFIGSTADIGWITGHSYVVYDLE